MGNHWKRIIQNRVKQYSVYFLFDNKSVSGKLIFLSNRLYLFEVWKYHVVFF